MFATRSLPSVASVAVGDGPVIGADDQIRVRLLPLLNDG